jgi:Domain of unknown function (DUF4194)
MSNSQIDVEEAASTVESDAATFPGDAGALPLATRRVLVQLLLGPSVDATRQRHLWPVLLRDEAVLRSRLHELFLELVVDREQQVAFTRQVVAENIDAPVLLRRSNLTFIETALVLFLRQRLTQAEAQGERAVVSADDMQQHLAVFERAANPDQARFGRQVLAAIEKAKKLNLVRLIGRGEQRFEVSPTLKLLFPAEEIQALTRTYQSLLARAQAGEDVAATGRDDDRDEEDPA